MQSTRNAKYLKKNINCKLRRLKKKYTIVTGKCINILSIDTLPCKVHS